MNPHHHSRIQQLQALLPRYQVDLLVVEDTTNLYYLTGGELSLGTLLIGEGSVALLVDGRYLTACQQSMEIPIYNSDGEMLKEQLTKPSIRSIGIDADIVTVTRHTHLQSLCSAHQKIVPLSSPLNPLRMIKDEDELSILRAAAVLGSEGYDYAASLLQEGCREEEIAIALEIFWKERGAQGPAFTPIIAFGPHSALPHYHAAQGILKANDSALIDIGVLWRHYHSDMTRVRFFGKPNPLLKEIYALVRDAQAAALALCRPGITVGALDNAARTLITKGGYGDNFTHGLGHGLGLAIHEAPLVRNREPYAAIPLEAGMVITIEPGIYLPGIGGVRLENSIVITEDGYEDLTLRSLDMTLDH